MDNELPKFFAGTVNIPKGIHHRIIKGTTDLFLQIEEYGNNSTRISA
jgi:hypothetical protein